MILPLVISQTIRNTNFSNIGVKFASFESIFLKKAKYN
uniref:Uncharacterized protein n=1 Tax=Prochlorococcus marinus str. P0903-H212 TaxID=1622208 RepID=A0A0D5A3M2_PROMR|nr:hypothetical protein FA03_0057 [Prochlorococcus marinus str. P0903-H212]